MNQRPVFRGGLLAAGLASLALLCTASALAMGTNTYPPTITNFTPQAQSSGQIQPVTVTGTGFLGTSVVTVGGIPATFTVGSDTTLVLAVPPELETAGAITVTTNSGSATSTAKFTPACGIGYQSTGSTNSSSVAACSTGDVAPIVSSFLPISGKAGSTVTITGKNLTGTYRVMFNASLAKPLAQVPGTAIKVISNTQVTVKVPTGVKTGLISVTTPNGNPAFSTTKFTAIVAPVVKKKKT